MWLNAFPFPRFDLFAFFFTAHGGKTISFLIDENYGSQHTKYTKSTFHIITSFFEP